MKLKNKIFKSLDMKNMCMIFKAVFFCFALFAGRLLNAEMLFSPSWGYSLDLPEGFILAEKSGNERYLFQHKILPADFQIAVYTKNAHKNINEVSAHIFSQLNMSHKDISFKWCGRNTLLSFGSFQSESSRSEKKNQMSAWMLILELAEEKGSLVLLTYAPFSKAKECEPLMISVLDSVFINSDSYTEPGPVTTALYPETGAIDISYDFNGKKINAEIDKSDGAANQSVVEREFSLLTVYLKTEFIEAAWKRYYKMIFRDAWKRMQPITFAFDLHLRNTKRMESKDFASEILKLLQSFTYTRNKNGSDFINLPDTLLSRTGDCDSRSLLMVLMLKQMGLDAVLLVSPKHAHALAAVKNGGKGAVFEHKGEKYVIAETTAKVEPGQIASEMADPKDWFAVDFPEYTAAEN